MHNPTQPFSPLSITFKIRAQMILVLAFSLHLEHQESKRDIYENIWNIF